MRCGRWMPVRLSKCQRNVHLSILIDCLGLACPTVKSDGTRYFFLSMTGMSVLSAFSQMTWWSTAEKAHRVSSIALWSYLGKGGGGGRATFSAGSSCQRAGNGASVLTGMRSLYLALMRSASALRLSVCMSRCGPSQSRGSRAPDGNPASD